MRTILIALMLTVAAAAGAQDLTADELRQSVLISSKNSSLPTLGHPYV